MRLAAFVLVLVMALGFGAWKQQESPSVASCGSVAGGFQINDRVTSLMEDVGRFVRWAESHKDDPIDQASIQKTIRSVWHEVLWLWLKALIGSGNGMKVDPQILLLHKKAAAERKAAEQGCTPCPVADGGGNAAPDSRMAFPAVLSKLSGPALAADALRRAGFPESEIAMGVSVAKLESGFDAKAVNPRLRSVNGMWQIYYGVHPELISGDRWDPYENARDARKVFVAAGNSWSPWTTARSAQAITQSTAPPPKSDGNSAGGSAKVETDPQISNGRTLADGCDAVAPAPKVDPKAPVETADWSQLRNPRTTAEAYTYLMGYVRTGRYIPVNRCLHYMADAYGWPSTNPRGGPNTATRAWEVTPDEYRHPGAKNPPRGALMYWGGGAGHIAYALGDGRAISTDAPVKNKIGIVDVDYLMGWGKPYLGWTAPFFYGQTKVGEPRVSVAA